MESKNVFIHNGMISYVENPMISFDETKMSSTLQETRFLKLCSYKEQPEIETWKIIIFTKSSKIWNSEG